MDNAVTGPAILDAHLQVLEHQGLPGTRLAITWKSPWHGLCYFSASALQAPSCERAASRLFETIRSLAIGVSGNCLIALLILSPHVCHVETPRPNLVFEAPGRLSTDGQAPLKISGHRLPVRRLRLQSCCGLCYQSVQGLALSCTHRSVSLKIIAAAEQFRQVPKGCRLIRQPLRGGVWNCEVATGTTPSTTHSRSAQVGHRSARSGSTTGKCMPCGALRDFSCRDRCRPREPAENCRQTDD